MPTVIDFNKRQILNIAALLDNLAESDDKNMIIDSLANAEKYLPIHKNFIKAFDFLKQQNLAGMPVGRYAIDGDNVYAMVQEPNLVAEKDGKWEAHKNYIDIQYVISGTEGIGYGNLPRFKEAVEYDKQRDIAFYTGSGSIVEVNAGEYMVLFPQDAHMPLIDIKGTGKVKKVVVKVKL